MSQEKEIVVLLQAFPRNLHPISKKILTTARALGEERGSPVRGILFCPDLHSALEHELKSSGLDEVFVLEGENFRTFVPEYQARILAELVKGRADVVLVPATPEGRSISSMLAAILHTGVTADCTELSFTEDGLLLQTRPAFSGSMMASIVTKTARPQIASLRYATPVGKRAGETAVIRHMDPVRAEPYRTTWVDLLDGVETKKGTFVVAVGGGVRAKEDLALFRELADALGAELYCSRALVDRGWLGRERQIGLSGQSVSPKLLIAFGISGSVQFRAGIEQVERLCVVDIDSETPLMKRADLPLEGDLYAVARSMLEQWEHREI